MTITIPVEVAAKAVDVPLLVQAEEYFKDGQRALAEDIIRYDFNMKYWSLPAELADNLIDNQTKETMETWRILYDDSDA